MPNDDFDLKAAFHELLGGRSPLQIDPNYAAMQQPQGNVPAAAPPASRPSPSPIAQSMLTKAYLAASGGKAGKAVSLTALREQLSNLPREVQDQVLLGVLQGKLPGFTLGQTSDPKALTKADKEAAFAPGGEPFHLIWMR